MKIILSLLLSLFCTSVFATPEAEAHIQAMLDKYQSLSIYEDHGITHIQYIKSDGSGFTDDKKFTTKYIENESLHFQWKEKKFMTTNQEHILFGKIKQVSLQNTHFTKKMKDTQAFPVLYLAPQVFHQV